MKRISIFLMLVVLVCSCSKDDINNISELQVQSRQSVDYQIDNFDPPRNYEDLRDCYNQFVRDGVETFNEKFGEDVGKRITYVTEGDISQVIPLFKGEELENIIWINEEYYFLLNKSEEQDSFGNPLRSYSRIFNLSKTEFRTGSANSLIQQFSIQNSENELRLTEYQKTSTPDEVYGKPYSPCSHWEDEWLLVYYDFFGLNPPIGGDLPPDVIEFSTMNEIINSITGGACVCPTPCLVIQALNTHTDVMQSAKDQVNINQLVQEFGLDISFPFELIESDKLFSLASLTCSGCKNSSTGSFINTLLDPEYSTYKCYEGTIYSISDDGILHVYVEPIDMNTSTDLQILEQIITVINAIHIYFCEGNDYEPIDWRDYFENYGSASGIVTWNGCRVGFDLTSILQPHYLMDTDPSWNHDTGSGWTYKWTGYNTNFPMLQITVDYSCTEPFDDLISPDCE
jgi:hypothetical protein